MTDSGEKRPMWRNAMSYRGKYGRSWYYYSVLFIIFVWNTNVFWRKKVEGRKELLLEAGEEERKAVIYEEEKEDNFESVLE